jgi:NhaA family Na+:H+ antiporter
VVWFFFLESGVHPTVAGVLVAFTIPASAKLPPVAFVDWARFRLDDIRACDVPGAHVLADDRQQLIADELSRGAKQVAAPLQRLEHALQSVSSLVILPLFALANAGVDLRAYSIGDLLLHPVPIGVFLGLFVGKPLGITLFTWLAVRTRLSRLPAGVEWRHIVGAGVLAGIGFTMSLFIANLAFRSALLQAEMKLGVLITSVAAGLAGYLLLRALTARETRR